MTLDVFYIEEEERLDICCSGDLDLTVTRPLCSVCASVREGLRYCIVDLSSVDRVFDSGLALLQMLYRRLRGLGTRVVFLAEDPAMRARLALFVLDPDLRPQRATARRRRDI
jgi:ABC-type transporter Mla MlaB component